MISAITSRAPSPPPITQPTGKASTVDPSASLTGSSDGASDGSSDGAGSEVSLGSGVGVGSVVGTAVTAPPPVDEWWVVPDPPPVEAPGTVTSFQPTTSPFAFCTTSLCAPTGKSAGIVTVSIPLTSTAFQSPNTTGVECPTTERYSPSVPSGS